MVANDSLLSVKVAPCVRDGYSSFLYELDGSSAYDKMLMRGALEGAGRRYAELEMANANGKEVHNVEIFLDPQGSEG